MKYILVALLTFVFSCTTFSKYSVNSKKINCNEENKSFFCYSNDSLKWNYTSFGGVKFVNNKSDFQKLEIKKSPKFKNVLLYGYSKILNGDYYILLDNKMYPETFVYKDTIINNNKITIAVSNNINGDYNKKFLLSGLH
ncbi:hypothetical protein ACM39_17615 [Chryseobacterium sp. FH2]|uniref:hypothetical protein n=1 Tax=Chryseobacterium sp. FH2 TaxID=1674291 RepID=UPI00065ADDF8|nr:hypothetical protein [Chryseobacterium sp. FH2]KMQ62927.1 hypothetical protein ACM39_17615 [Chryseobacterium sp. FH2]